MYYPNPDDLYKFWLRDSLDDAIRGYGDLFDWDKYTPLGDKVVMPDRGYIICMGDFSIIYDISKVDDGTVNNSEDAQVLLMREIVNYFANVEKDWHKVELIITGNYYSTKYYVGYSKIPSVRDCAKRPFAVGDRTAINRGVDKFVSSFCLRLYNMFYSKVSPNDSLSFDSCEDWFGNQFTWAVGDWQSITTSGWRTSRGFPLIFGYFARQHV